MTARSLAAVLIALSVRSACAQVVTAESLWKQSQAFGALPAPGRAFVPPMPTVFQVSDDRTPSPLIQPGKPAPVLKDGPASGVQPLATIDLHALHNNLWRTSLTAAVGGHTLHVSAQASHEGHYFLVIHDPQGKTFFLKDTTLALSSVDITINGVTVHVTLDMSVLDLWGSKLVLTDRSNGSSWSFPLRDITKAMYEAGQSLTLNGRTFRVHYTDQAFEDGSGRVARVGQPLLVLMVEQSGYKSEKDHYVGDAVEADAIPLSDAGKILVGSFKIPPYGLFAHAFRKTDGGKSLEIYPAP